jgi:primase-polymerase (primpol)-like protein
MHIEQQPHPLHSIEEQKKGGIHADQIPLELVDYSQWVCWRYVDRGECRKPDKQPVNPRNLANAGVHWANTWAPFEVAYAVYKQHGSRRVHGIGFVLTPTDPYVAIDLDACVQEDEIASKAAQIINDLSSYTELSPSGHGIHILLAVQSFRITHAGRILRSIRTVAM